MEKRTKKNRILLHVFFAALIFALPTVRSFVLEGVYASSSSPWKEILYCMNYAIGEAARFAALALVVWSYSFAKKHRLEAFLISAAALLVPYISSVLYGIRLMSVLDAEAGFIWNAVLGYLIEMIVLGVEILISALCGAKMTSGKRRVKAVPALVLIPSVLYKLGSEIYSTVSFVYDLKNYYYDTMTADELFSIIGSYAAIFATAAAGYLLIRLFIKLIDKIVPLGDNPRIEITDSK